LHPDPRLTAALARCPLIAILRGIRPDEVVAIADVLVEEGFALIEVPLNSPDPYASIAALAGRYPAPVLTGAGTVLSVAQAEQVRTAGGDLVISPNTDPAIIAAAAAAGGIALPGFFTPSEAFAAIASGASGLKLFPAEAASPAVLKAQRAVLPRDLPVFVVGGIQPEAMAAWLEAGAQGFGIGSSLYAPGKLPEEVRASARSFIQTWRAIGASA